VATAGVRNRALRRAQRNPLRDQRRMNRNNYPAIALAVSAPLLALLVFGAQAVSDGSTRLPLLTLLAISEFGAIANAVAVWLSIAALIRGQFEPRRAVTGIAAFVFAAVFTWYLIRFWPL
jgi:hypothetical protein